MRQAICMSRDQAKDKAKEQAKIVEARNLLIEVSGILDKNSQISRRSAQKL